MSAWELTSERGTAGSGCGSDDGYSTCTFAALMILPHLSSSVEIRAVNFSGELAMENVMAGARNLSRNAGSAKIFWVSAVSFVTISGGVALGAAKPYHEPAW